MIWFLVPPSRSIRSVPVTRSISLVSACGRMLCAVFVSSFSCDVPWRRVVSFSLSSRPSSRRLVSWGVSWLFFAVRPSSRLAHQCVRRLVKQFVLVSLGRLARRLVGRLVRRSGSPSCLSFLGVSPCSVHRSLSRPSSCLPVSSSSPHSLVSPGGSWGVSCSLSVSRLILSVLGLISLISSHDHGDGLRLVLPLPRGCVPYFLFAIRHHGGVAMTEMGVPFDDTRDAPFS